MTNDEYQLKAGLLVSLALVPVCLVSMRFVGIPISQCSLVSMRFVGMPISKCFIEKLRRGCGHDTAGQKPSDGHQA
jgi:hypothetical protein